MADDSDNWGATLGSSDDVASGMAESSDSGDDVVAAPQGFGERLGDSLGAIIAGLLLVPLACIGLFWNEGHSVAVARALDEVKGIVRTVPTDRLDPALNGALVHVAGGTTSANGVSDEALGVHAKGLKLTRTVRMYQWRESESGSGQDRKFTYTREWADHPISSSNFHAPGGHQNPAFPSYRSRDLGAPDARIEAMPVGAAATLRLHGAEEISIDGSGLAAAQKTTGRPTQASGGGYYVGANPDLPRVGDVRISYAAVPEGPASFIGRQEPGGLEPYRARNGQEVLLAYPGTWSADDVVQKGQDDNRLLTWILRGAGLVVMLLGFFLLFAPVNVLSSYVPVLGSLVSGATFLVALVATLVVGPIVIALAWLAVRPLLAGGLIAGAILLALGFRALRARRRPPALAPAATA